MNSELNTPKALHLRVKYVNELTSIPYWQRVGPCQEVEGWTPGPNLRKRLVLEEIGNLTRDILENKKRIKEWLAQRKSGIRLAEPEVLKINRSILRWESYTEALIALRSKLIAVL